MRWRLQPKLFSVLFCVGKMLCMPRPRPSPKEAPLGSFDSRDARDLRAIEEFLVWRDQGINQLFGVKRPPNRLRDSLMRQILIAFSEGRVRPISYYRGVCARIGSRMGVQREVHTLESYGLVILRPSERDRRTIQVWPTEKLIEWFQRSLVEVRRILDRELREYPDRLPRHDGD